MMIMNITYLEDKKHTEQNKQTYCNGLIARANEEALEIIRKAKERYDDET